MIRTHQIGGLMLLHACVVNGGFNGTVTMLQLSRKTEAEKHQNMI